MNKFTSVEELNHWVDFTIKNVLYKREEIISDDKIKNSVLSNILAQDENCGEPYLCKRVDGYKLYLSYKDGKLNYMLLDNNGYVVETVRELSNEILKGFPINNKYFVRNPKFLCGTDCQDFQ